MDQAKAHHREAFFSLTVAIYGGAAITQGKTHVLETGIWKHAAPTQNYTES